MNLDTLVLAHGAHDNPDEGMCLLEAVAFMAGEPFSDHPACVSPVLAAFGRTWNDGLPHEDRQQLKAYVPRLIGTAGDPVVDERRAWMAADWSVRVHAPTWLRLAGLTDHADALAGLPEIVSSETARSAQPAIDAARAARDAAGDAAWDAAWDAAGDAAGAAAWDAAWAAARAAAGAALAPTVTELQASAHDLFDRMIEAAA